MIVPRTKNFIFSFSPEIFKYTNQRCCQVYIQFHHFCVFWNRAARTQKNRYCIIKPKNVTVGKNVNKALIKLAIVNSSVRKTYQNFTRITFFCEQMNIADRFYISDTTHTVTN